MEKLLRFVRKASLWRRRRQQLTPAMLPITKATAAALRAHTWDALPLDLSVEESYTR